MGVIARRYFAGRYDRNANPRYTQFKKSRVKIDILGREESWSRLDSPRNCELEIALACPILTSCGFDLWDENLGTRR